MYIVPRVYYKNDRTIFHFFDLEYLEADGHFVLRIIGTNSSDFVATRIMHELYKLCCEKRFRPYEVQQLKQEPRTTLYKYLVIPKEAHEPPKPQLLQPETPNQDSASSENSSAPRPLPRSSSKNNNKDQSSETSEESSSSAEQRARSRSGTLPFIQGTEAQQSRRRSQSRPSKEDGK